MNPAFFTILSRVFPVTMVIFFNPESAIKGCLNAAQRLCFCFVCVCVCMCGCACVFRESSMLSIPQWWLKFTTSHTAVYGEKLEFKLQQFIMTDSPAKTGRNLTNAIHILSKNWLMKSDYIKHTFLISYKMHTGFVDTEKCTEKLYSGSKHTPR